MSCRQGPSERYAPLGLSFPPLPRRAPPIHEATGGYAAPKAPAGQSCSEDVFPANTDDWGFPLTTDDFDSRRRMIVTTDEFFRPGHQTPPYTKKGL